MTIWFKPFLKKKYNLQRQYCICQNYKGTSRHRLHICKSQLVSRLGWTKSRWYNLGKQFHWVRFLWNMDRCKALFHSPSYKMSMLDIAQHPRLVRQLQLIRYIFELKHMDSRIPAAFPQSRHTNTEKLTAKKFILNILGFIKKKIVYLINVLYQCVFLSF